MTGFEPRYVNHPFYEIAEAITREIDRGHTIYQKYTCDNCGSRQTMQTPNKLYIRGICEECGYTTDIVATGCNYLMITNKGVIP